MKPTYLYIKQHAITGLRYFGKTIRSDVENYLGSGVYWNNHLKKHGSKYVKTLWVSKPFIDEEDIKEFALFVSEELNIVKSNKWANLMPENGIDGGDVTIGMTIEKIEAWKQKQSFTKINKSPEAKAISRERYRLANLGENNPNFGVPHTQEWKDENSSRMKGNQYSLGKIHTQDWKDENSSHMKGNQYAKGKGRKHSLTTYPHCLKIGGIGSMKRWHFDNCKGVTLCSEPLQY